MEAYSMLKEYVDEALTLATYELIADDEEPY